MNEIFNIATIFVCTAITTGVVALALTYACLMESREKATVWWCWGMWTATVGLAIVAVRGSLPWWLGIGVGNALIFLGYGIVRKGYATFRDVEISSFTLWGGVSVWFALYFGIDAIRSDFNHRIILASVIILAYSSLIAADAWRGWRQDHLPSFLALTVLFATHAFMYLIRIAMTLAYPAKESFGTGGSVWLSLMALESYIHAIGISFLFFALYKERAERRYRLAAEIDSLTGAATRRFFVSETRARLAKGGKAGVLAVMDLDFFKTVNDCYGHLGGDRVLQAFGNFMTGRLGPGMVFGRLGGEEFGLFLPDMEASEAREVLEAIRAEIEAMQIPFMGSPIRITISIGAASVREAGVDFDHLMAAADSALYVAKEEGRNRLRLFTLSMRMHRIVEEGRETRLGLTEQRLSRMNVRSRIGG